VLQQHHDRVNGFARRQDIDEHDRGRFELRERGHHGLEPVDSARMTEPAIEPQHAKPIPEPLEPGRRRDVELRLVHFRADQRPVHERRHPGMQVTDRGDHRARRAPDPRIDPRDVDRSGGRGGDTGSR
jgi:hypothetical protein